MEEIYIDTSNVHDRESLLDCLQENEIQPTYIGFHPRQYHTIMSELAKWMFAYDGFNHDFRFKHNGEEYYCKTTLLGNRHLIFECQN